MKHLQIQCAISVRKQEHSEIKMICYSQIWKIKGDSRRGRNNSSNKFIKEDRITLFLYIAI